MSELRARARVSKKNIHIRFLGDSHPLPNHSVHTLVYSPDPLIRSRLPALRRRDKYLLFKIPALRSRARAATPQDKPPRVEGLAYVAQHERRAEKRG